MQNKVTSIQHYWFAGYIRVFSITINLTVHGEIVDPRLTFMVNRDWLKTGRMIQSLEFDRTIPQPNILSSAGQLLRRAL